MYRNGVIFKVTLILPLTEYTLPKASSIAQSNVACMFFDRSFRSFIVSRFVFSTFPKCSPCMIIFILGHKKNFDWAKSGE